MGRRARHGALQVAQALVLVVGLLLHHQVSGHVVLDWKLLLVVLVDVVVGLRAAHRCNQAGGAHAHCHLVGCLVFGVLLLV